MLFALCILHFLAARVSFLHLFGGCQPCRLPDRMYPCLESHGINLIPTLEENGLDFNFAADVITWYSLIFFNE